MKTLHAAVAASLLLALGQTGVAGAQTTPDTTTPATAPAAPAPDTASTPYVDANCGGWQQDAWVTNGMCPNGDLHKHERVAGTITAVKGHLVTVQQSTRSVVIDDTPALNRETSGKVAVGRSIVAHGYWDGNNFYATLIATSDKSSTP